MGGVFSRKITCRWCGNTFYICHSCWRGQGYCSDACRIQGYRRDRQKRQRKYRRSEKGKKTHRKNENNRKKRLAAKKVGDARSNTFSSLIYSPPNTNSNCSCCRFCGQTGEIVTTFPRRHYGRSPVNGSVKHFTDSGTS